jgi:hypothetical protein
MTLIPIGALAPCELLALGNNLPPGSTAPRRRGAHASEDCLDPVHRSLASVGEDVEWCETPSVVWPGDDQPQA